MRDEGSLKIILSLSSRASVEGSCLERSALPNTAKEFVAGALARKTRSTARLALLARRSAQGDRVEGEACSFFPPVILSKRSPRLAIPNERLPSVILNQRLFSRLSFLRSEATAGSCMQER